MLAGPTSWLFYLLFLQLVLWTAYLPLGGIALAVTFLVARRFRRGRRGALTAVTIGFATLSVFFFVGTVGAGATSSLPGEPPWWVDVAILMGYFGITFLPMAYFTGRLAVKTGLEADLRQAPSPAGATDIPKGGPWR